MDKLNFIETMNTEIDEANRAKKYYEEQKKQVSKRLYYIPTVIKFIFVLFIVVCMYSIVWMSGFITGERTQQKNNLYCRKEVKSVNITPIFTCSQTLPKTGAGF